MLVLRAKFPILNFLESLVLPTLSTGVLPTLSTGVLPTLRPSLLFRLSLNITLHDIMVSFGFLPVSP